MNGIEVLQTAMISTIQYTILRSSAKQAALDRSAGTAVNAHLIPAYQKGLSGARYMPSSRAFDRVAN